MRIRNVALSPARICLRLTDFNKKEIGSWKLVIFFSDRFVCKICFDWLVNSIHLPNNIRYVRLFNLDIVVYSGWEYRNIGPGEHPPIFRSNNLRKATQTKGTTQNKNLKCLFLIVLASSKPSGLLFDNLTNYSQTLSSAQWTTLENTVL